KENAEYHAARERQSFIEGRIGYLEGVVADCEVIDVSKIKGDKVFFGATVTLMDVDTEQHVNIHLSESRKVIRKTAEYRLKVR
ncbi:MAG TPA: hypothetical protein PLX56_04955, partial [bacterium]|nr:hypothetical protein [bacterium]